MRFMNEFYPAPALMKLARAHDLDLITIGSDSHKPEDLGKDVTRAIEYLKAYGFEYVQTFDQRERSRLKI
jgi:histidinol-phosphatase (PHP family)